LNPLLASDLGPHPQQVMTGAGQRSDRGITLAGDRGDLPDHQGLGEQQGPGPCG
jgi:hypothetical protein